MRIPRVSCLSVLLGSLTATIAGQEPVREAGGGAITNWPAPAYWSPAEVPRDAREGVHPLQVKAIQPGAFPFIPIAPCRQFDIRPGTLADNANLTIPLAGAPCGIPSYAAAVSANITVFAIIGAGGNGVFRVGIANDPPTAWINYPPTETQRANAGVVTTDGAGNIVVKVNQGGGTIQLTVDVNGYYAGAGTLASLNTFLGLGAGNFTMTGIFNTGIGPSALANNSSGSSNTATGASALSNNTTGDSNTAGGAFALLGNTTGTDNTASGRNALYNNNGRYNSASGRDALSSNTTGNLNTATGYYALAGNTTGSVNIAIGAAAGFNLTTGDNNIDIGNQGVAGEANTIRIGGVQTRAFIAGIRGVMTGMADAIPVVIDSDGQLGTVSSSARFKEEIRDMGSMSGELLKLRPVTFRYKGQAEGSIHFGLIAEEVDEVLPELVAHTATGEPETVLYHEMPAMLLNELQKQQTRLEEQETRLSAQQKLIESLEARLAALEKAPRE